MDFLWNLAWALNEESGLDDDMKKQILSAMVSRLHIILNSIVSRGKTPTFSTDQHTIIEVSSVKPLIAAMSSVAFRPLTEASLALHKDIRIWSLKVLGALFDHQVSLNTRWGNFKLLGMMTARDKHRSFGCVQHAENGKSSSSIEIEWRALCVMRILEDTVQNLDLSPQNRSAALETLRAVWETWTGEYHSSDLSPYVERPVLTTFLRLAAMIRDEPVHGLVWDHCLSHGLLSEAKDLLGSWQVEAILAERIAASALGDEDLMKTLADIRPCAQSEEHRSALIQKAIARLLVYNVKSSIALYEAAKRNGLLISVDTLLEICRALVRSGQVEDATAKIRQLCLVPSPDLRGLAADLLQSLRELRWQVSGTTLEEVGNCLIQAYRTLPPPLLLRSQLCYALQVMTQNGHAVKAARLVKAIHDRDVSFLPPSEISRLLVGMMRRRAFKAAAEVLHATASAHPTHIVRWNQIVVLGAMRAGASKIAAQVDALNHSTRFSGLPILSLARLAKFRRFPVSRITTLKAMRKLLCKQATDPDLSPVYQEVVQLLLFAGRVTAAKRLFIQAKSHPSISEAVRTSMGNAIIHAIHARPRLQRARTMRKVFDTLAVFVKEHSFVPDRVTVNILVKTLTRWPAGVDASRLRALFDHIIRSGYPAGPRFSTGQVPFGTAPSGSRNISILQGIKTPPTFDQHVRPMYKMFIKAFHQRGDMTAAHMIVGILKDVQVEERRKNKEDENIINA